MQPQGDRVKRWYLRKTLPPVWARPEVSSEQTMQYMYVVVFVSSSNSSHNTVQMRRRGPKGDLKIFTKRTAREPARGGSVWVWMSVDGRGRHACSWIRVSVVWVHEHVLTAKSLPSFKLREESQGRTQRGPLWSGHNPWRWVYHHWNR